jgi:hypothetical protein
VTDFVPDDKDWTWVLDRPCPECGFDAATLARDDIPARLRDCARTLSAALAAPDARERPAPNVWSTLEYGAHVRDVFAIYAYRLGLMLEQDDPLYPNWDQDVTAVEKRYGQQDPAVVASELLLGVEPLAARFAGLSDAEWSRPGQRSDGAAFTVETFGRYLVHDPVHHVFDVTGQRAGD